MNDNRPVRAYVVIFLTVVATVIVPVLALNYTLGLRSLGGGNAVLEASRWQQASHGVTYAPPLSNNRPFKTARLFDRLPDINTVVLGSSTAMGVTQDMFPERMRIYNFAQTGNALLTAISEAEYLQARQPAVKWLVIPLDWALGFIYEAGTPGYMELTPPATTAVDALPAVPLTKQLQDALSLPRVRNLASIIKSIARSDAKWAAFRDVFLENAGAEYRCADRTPARDFDTIFRGTCTGFRFDGSATFGNLEAVAPRRAEALNASAAVASSKYALALARTGGAPNPVILDRVAALARAMRERGGGVILFMPPLLPGLERVLLDSPQTGVPLRRTREALDQWARAQNLVIIDGGQSERYACRVPEFVDEHHATAKCYARLFGRYWRDTSIAGKVHAGLYGVE